MPRRWCARRPGSAPAASRTPCLPQRRRRSPAARAIVGGADVDGIDGRIGQHFVDRGPALRDALLGANAAPRARRCSPPRRPRCPGWARIAPIIHSRASCSRPPVPNPAGVRWHSPSVVEASSAALIVRQDWSSAPRGTQSCSRVIQVGNDSTASASTHRPLSGRFRGHARRRRHIVARSRCAAGCPPTPCPWPARCAPECARPRLRGRRSRGAGVTGLAPRSTSRRAAAGAMSSEPTPLPAEAAVAVDRQSRMVLEHMLLREVEMAVAGGQGRSATRSNVSRRTVPLARHAGGFALGTVETASLNRAHHRRPKSSPRAVSTDRDARDIDRRRREDGSSQWVCQPPFDF